MRSGGMARFDLESSLKATLAASLTPSAPRITAEHRDEQSSGIVDVGALYAASLEHVMQRARRELPASLRGTRALRPAPFAPPWTTPELELDDADLLVEFDGIPGLRAARGVGWFGVAVAWLMTATMGAIVATTLPAHVGSHALSRTLARAAISPATPTAAPPAPAPATPWTAIPTATPTATATPTPTATATPTIQAPAAPRAVTARPISAAPHLVARPVPVQAPASTAPAQAPASKTVAAAAPSAPAVPVAPAAAAAPASTNVDLDELIRRAVKAEATKAQAKGR
jgi:hypothetical protein